MEATIGHQRRRLPVSTKFGIRCTELLLICRKSFPQMPHPKCQSNGGLEQNRSRGSGEWTTMTTSQSRKRRLISCWNDNDSHRIRSGRGMISTRTEWCFFGVGGCEGQRHDWSHCRKTKQLVAVQCPCWHCTATLKIKECRPTCFILRTLPRHQQLLRFE